MIDKNAPLTEATLVPMIAEMLQATRGGSMNAYKTYEDADGVWLRESGGDLNGPYETVREALEDVARDAALCDGQQVANLPLSAVVEYARLTLGGDE